MTDRELPIPPPDLAERVGPLHQDPGSAMGKSVALADWWVPGDPKETYLRVGRAIHDDITSALPAGFSLTGSRVLDFGSGAGRVLRHFADLAEDGEFWGSDIDSEAIAWATANLNPPFKFNCNGYAPPLPFDDGYFDLIYATSVFTHITDEWSSWLLEMHRLLRPDGLLFASFLHQAAAAWEPAFYELLDEDRTGMNVVRPWLHFRDGGPNVFHSLWWLKAHWGRAFEFVSLQPDGLAMPSGHGQGFAVLRRTSVSLSIDDLERDEPDEPRELVARRHNWRQLANEGALIRDQLQNQERSLRTSLSWRITRPVRALGRIAQNIRR